MYDIVITGGAVIDGTGSAARVANIGLKGDRIVAISGDELKGERVVDAAGYVVAPGFIDIHSHADFTVQRAPQAVTQLAQGVTTVIGGNCGMSPFPLSSLNRVRHDHLDYDLASDEVTWTDFDGYARAVEKEKPAINLAMHIGHGTVRAAVMGGENRAPDPDELAAMCALVHTAAEQGVFGFSSGLIYPPGRFAETEEMVALVSQAAADGLLYSTHVRNETSAVVDAVDEAISTARGAGARLEVSHLKGMGPTARGLSRQALEHIHKARAQGLDVTCDVYPYTASSTSLASRLPSWVLDGGPTKLAERLQDLGTAARAAEGLRERFGKDIDPAGIVLAEIGPGPFADCAGLSLVELAERRGTDAAQIAVEVLRAHGDVMIVNHAIDEDDMRVVLSDALTAVASDGWVLTERGSGTPHPRSFGTFARVLGRYVREQGLLTLQDAVRKMTSLPAERIGIADRGILAEGKVADIVVFDPEQVVDLSSYDDPWKLSTGVTHVIVAGEIAFAGGTVTGTRAGRVLRKAAV